MTFSIQDPEQSSTQYPSLMGLIGTVKGYENWSGPIDHIGYSDAARDAHVIRNLSTGGHLHVKKSTDGTTVARITDTGLNVLEVAATAITATSVTSSGVVQGTRLISTIATGTAPLTVTSTTKVANLNVDLLDGLDSTAFVLRAGDTMTGVLTMEPAVATDQIVKLKGSSTSGGFWLGATNVAAPALMLRDNANALMLLVNPTGSTYALDVNNGLPASNAARFTGDVLITTDLGVRTVTATTNVTAAKMAAGGTSFSGSEKLHVIGSALIDSGLTVAASGINVTGSSVFASGISVTTGGVTVTSGGVTLTAAPLTIGSTVASAGDIRGTSTLSINGRTSGGSNLELVSISGDVLQIGTNSSTGILFTGASTQRFRWDATGMAFFGSATAAKQTVTGSRGGNAALASFLSAMANYGAITDSTTA